MDEKIPTVFPPQPSKQLGLPPHNGASQFDKGQYAIIRKVEILLEEAALEMVSRYDELFNEAQQRSNKIAYIPELIGKITKANREIEVKIAVHVRRAGEELKEHYGELGKTKIPGVNRTYSDDIDRMCDSAIAGIALGLLIKGGMVSDRIQSIIREESIKA